MNAKQGDFTPSSWPLRALRFATPRAEKEQSLEPADKGSHPAVCRAAQSQFLTLVPSSFKRDFRFGELYCLPPGLSGASTFRSSLDPSLWLSKPPMAPLLPSTTSTLLLPKTSSISSQADLMAIIHLHL
ncbi:hypothetical protein CB1_001533052 [Camelus ferus]|nr:hypothetical protein CB1_001533052 [Camelus ferus]